MTTTTFFIIFIPILSILLLAINLLLAPHFPYQEKDSAFECGFHSFLGQNRKEFSISFFIFGLLFLLFDLEIVLIYPYSVSSYSNDGYGLSIMMIFFILLTLGFIFELGKNALSIDSKQTVLPDKENAYALDAFLDNCVLQSGFLFSNSASTLCAAPMAWGLYFQDSASPQLEDLIELHNDIMYYFVAILFAVGWITAAIIKNPQRSRTPISNKYLNGTLIELIWTITPALILVLIAFPSFKLLYLMDEVTDPSLSVLAEGHQWYWSYEYPDFLNSDGDFVEFDAYLVPDDLTYESRADPNPPRITEAEHIRNIANCENHQWTHRVNVTPHDISQNRIPNCDFSTDRPQGVHVHRPHSAIDPARGQYTYWFCMYCAGVVCANCIAG